VVVTMNVRAYRCAGVILSVCVLLGGCADEPVAYSETVSLKLSGMKAKDVKSGVVTEEKNVNTETGNPYGDFLKNATDSLSGVEPSRVVLSKATLGLHSDSEGISRLDQVFKRIELFVSSSSSTTILGVATSLSAAEATVAIDENIDWDDLASVMLAGDFKVGVRCETNATTPKEWEARLFLDLNFSAFE
jgi:hypothetical protein